jgi:hypothetical protein
MPSYDIRYLNDDGTLVASVAAECADDTKAKVLAHAMKNKDHARLEVWDGENLVYERPQRSRSYRRALLRPLKSASQSMLYAADCGRYAP